MLEEPDQTVTVIIPTLGLVERAEHIRLAIDSVLHQEGVNATTFIHYTDSPLGIWNSDACKLGLPNALERPLSLHLPPDLRGVFARRRTQACHQAADASLRNGQLRAALGWHVRCLSGVNGWRYFPFMGKLLRGLVRV